MAAIFTHFSPAKRLGLFWGVLVIGSFLSTPEVTPEFSDTTEASGITFTHISGDPAEARYIFEAKGGGVAFFDYDNDGWQDIYIVQGSSVDRLARKMSPLPALYRNMRNGTFKEVTQEAGINFRGWGMGVACGDFNNDGYVDLYLTNLGANVLYKNNGNGTFTDISQLAGVGDANWSTSAAFADYDQDGDLDLYVANYIQIDFDNLPPPACNYRGNPVLCGPNGLPAARDTLYRNNADGTFTDVSSEAGVSGGPGYYGLGVVWADIDNDLDLDLYVANDATPNYLFINQGNGTFRDMSYPSGLAVSRDGDEQASMGVDIADYDNDGWLDVFVTHFASEYSTLYHNDGGGKFQDVTPESGIFGGTWLKLSWGTRFGDFDLDGWKDILLSNGHVYPYLLKQKQEETYRQSPSLFLNQKNGTFKDVSSRAGNDFAQVLVGRGAAFGDYNNDGKLDCLIANLNGTPRLFRNDLDSAHHWVTFRAIGRESNRDGIGTRVTVSLSGIRQVWEVKRSVGIYSTSDPRAHFGLGTSKTIDLVQVQWPGGRVQRFESVSADRHYVIDELTGLSVDKALR